MSKSVQPPSVIYGALWQREDGKDSIFDDETWLDAEPQAKDLASSNKDVIIGEYRLIKTLKLVNTTDIKEV